MIANASNSSLEADDRARRRLDRRVGDRARGPGAGRAPAASPIVDAYWEHVSRSPAELQELIEAVVVPETWFFRDRRRSRRWRGSPASEWLHRAARTGARCACSACRARRARSRTRWRWRCSTPGLPAERFRIDAVDISGPALAHARRGIYGRNSFRGQDLAFRDRHFVATGGRLPHRRTRLRGLVRFLRATCSSSVPADDGAYDVVFCRNLLIYFDAADQSRAVAVLRRLLAPNGVLFVGHSEAGLLLDEGFASARIPLAFAFRKRDATPAHGPRQSRPARPGGTVAGSAALRPAAGAGPTGASARPGPRPRVEPATGIDDIRRIADARRPRRAP